MQTFTTPIPSIPSIPHLSSSAREHVDPEHLREGRGGDVRLPEGLVERRHVPDRVGNPRVVHCAHHQVGQHGEQPVLVRRLVHQALLQRAERRQRVHVEAERLAEVVQELEDHEAVGEGLAGQPEAGDAGQVRQGLLVWGRRMADSQVGRTGTLAGRILGTIIYFIFSSKMPRHQPIYNRLIMVTALFCSKQKFAIIPTFQIASTPPHSL